MIHNSLTKKLNGRRAWVLSLCMSLAAFGPALAAEDAAEDSAKDSGQIGFEADNLEYDGKEDVITLSGSVVLRQDGYELCARSITYDRKKGQITAAEGLTLKDAEGNVLGASAATLDDRLLAGFASGIMLILSDGARVAAHSAERSEGRLTRFDHALYSPCKVCGETGRAATPLWRVKALRVEHDQVKRKIAYRHVWIEFLGVPLVYTPWLSHPDPSLKRATGFLTPQFKTRKELGLSIGIPYYFALSDSADLTLTPTWNTAEGPLLSGEYRQKFRNAGVKIEGSATYPQKRDAFNVKTGEHYFRGHLFADGEFQHSNHWRSAMRLEWASDDTYMRRYMISDRDVLTNRYALEGFFGRSYVSAEAMHFAGLRLLDDNGLAAYALPLLHAEYVSPPSDFGTFHLSADGAALHRSDGLDSRRMTLEGNWEKRAILESGLIFRFAADLRGDLYRVNDAAHPDNPLFGGENGNSARFLPQASAAVSWPLVRSGKSFTQILEPMISAVLTPNGGNPSGIPNEDSRAFELADTNIFADNRFPGYDRWEPGPRVTYGVNWNVSGRSVSSEFLLAQSWRNNTTAAVFPDGTGLSGHFSDLVGRWHLQLGGKFDLYERFRLDKNNLAIRRNEVDLGLTLKQGSFTIGYMELNRDLQAFELEDRREIRAAGKMNLAGGWRLDGFINRNLDGGGHPLTHGLGLTFENECFLFSVDWQHSYFIDRDIVPGTSFGFQLKLKTLG